MDDTAARIAHLTTAVEEQGEAIFKQLKRIADHLDGKGTTAAMAPDALPEKVIYYVEVRDLDSDTHSAPYTLGPYFDIDAAREIVRVHRKVIKTGGKDFCRKYVALVEVYSKLEE
jgi:hypothetical protein